MENDHFLKKIIYTQYGRKVQFLICLKQDI